MSLVFIFFLMARDNFFDLKSWLPPQPRRLADQWLGEWASGLNNLALDVGMLKVGMNGKMESLGASTHTPLQK